MTAQVTKNSNSTPVLLWAAGIAVILFSVAGIAAIMGWIPTSIGGSAEKATLAQTKKPSLKPAQSTAAGAKSAPAKVASNAPVSVKCAECGVIESTREIATSGEGTGLGAAGGAVVGGLLGHQVGGGSGKQIATVVGAVGGAVAGNEVEKRVKSTKSYEITVRLDDGSIRVIGAADPPTWRTGDHVKVVDGVIRAN
ncbi:MAG: glycine zipper protein [Proteobacteria bacterium]|nr:glycine zipper protein [Pseudomonadota bacterium]